MKKRLTVLLFFVLLPYLAFAGTVGKIKGKVTEPKKFPKPKPKNEIKPVTKVEHNWSTYVLDCDGNVPLFSLVC